MVMDSIQVQLDTFPAPGVLPQPQSVPCSWALNGDGYSGDGRA